MPRLAKSQILWENFLTRSSNPPSQNSHPFPPIPPRCGQGSHRREISGFPPQRGAIQTPNQGAKLSGSDAFSRPRLPHRLPGRLVLTRSSASAPSGPRPTGRSATPAPVQSVCPDARPPRGTPHRGLWPFPPTLPPARAPRAAAPAPLPSRTTRALGQPARRLVLREPNGPPRPSAPAP